MQKITSYLYPNRVLTSVDLASNTTEWRIVYQRNIKIYKGLDNIIEFDFRNAQQRKVDVSNLTIRCIIMDQQGNEIDTARVLPTSLTGISSMTIPRVILENVDPQYLKYTLYVETDEGLRVPVYSDTQFGVSGLMELLGGVVSAVPAPIEITSFTELNGAFYSDVDLYLHTFIDLGLEFLMTSFAGTIQVLATDAAVITSQTGWTTLDTFQVDELMETAKRRYQSVNDSSNSIKWLRIRYIPNTENTGTVDKVLIIL